MHPGVAIIFSSSVGNTHKETTLSWQAQARAARRVGGFVEYCAEPRECSPSHPAGDALTQGTFRRAGVFCRCRGRDIGGSCMPADDDSAPQPDQKCERCGAATELLSFIPRFGERPAYRIFECGTCSALTWIAEAISG